MAKLANAGDSKSPTSVWGFDSLYPYQKQKVNIMEKNEIDKKVYELFGAMVTTEDDIVSSPNFYASASTITNFEATPTQLSILKSLNKPLNMKTLFGVKERENSTPEQLILKQIFHYIEVYGLEQPGLFDLEVDSGQVITLRYVEGITTQELSRRMLDIAYTNAPIKNTQDFYDIIKYYGFFVDINRVENNELRVLLFDPLKDTFDSGDDAVRYMCYVATGDTLLIKSKEVIDAVKAKVNSFDSGFFERHSTQLAEVFNRHKAIILAAKKPSTKTAINRISRLSKNLHVPIKEAINKRFVSLALNDKKMDMSVLSRISVRDKFKYLNLLSDRSEFRDMEAYIIRNGKVHLSKKNREYTLKDIERVRDAVINSLSEDLSALRDKDIYLDPNVDYGLPVSRKQTLGHLPFGTTVTPKSNKISSGIYWENNWGAYDLDLSAINKDGGRVGWGQTSSYTNETGIVFSGDITSATRGAMEFLTSKDKTYALLNNIYSGSVGCGTELVVGKKTSDKWIDKPIIREKFTMTSRSMVLGFVKNKSFVVYTLSTSGGSISTERNKFLLQKGLNEFWTIRKLFDTLGINYSLDKSDGFDYDYDMGYDKMTYDKLENMLL